MLTVLPPTQCFISEEQDVITQQTPNAGLMLGQPRRKCTNLELYKYNYFYPLKWVSEYCYTSLSVKSWQYRVLLFFKWLQGLFIVHRTIGSTVHPRPLNSLEHCSLYAQPRWQNLYKSSRRYEWGIGAGPTWSRVTQLQVGYTLNYIASAFRVKTRCGLLFHDLFYVMRFPYLYHTFIWQFNLPLILTISIWPKKVRQWLTIIIIYSFCENCFH